MPDGGAHTLGWGEPTRVAEFDDGLGPNWEVYDGPAPHGRRALSTITVSGGTMTITGDGAGPTGEVCWLPGRTYGRSELRTTATTADPAHHAVALLSPDEGSAGGEIDFVKLAEPTRQVASTSVRNGSGTAHSTAEHVIDATHWRTWAVEWAPTHVAAFVDGVEWFRTDASNVPAGPMHLCIQLATSRTGGPAGPTAAALAVDWVRLYAAPGTGERR